MDKKTIEDRLRDNSWRWLVTGAAGFIGSNLCHRLLELGQEVVGLDNFSTGKKANIEELNSRDAGKAWRFIQGDICHFETCEKALEGVDFVLQQAAVGSVPRSLDTPMVSHASNVDGFLKIITATKGSKAKKIVYASSSSVYGDHPGLPRIEHLVGEPMSPYAATKKIDEIYAKVFRRCFDLPIVGLRYFNVFGPRQNSHGPYAAVIPLWIESVLQGEDIQINGDGSYSRDFCYIENVIQANLLAALSGPQCNGEVYNIAFGDRTDLNTLFGIIREAIRSADPNLVPKDPIYRALRKGDVPHSHADISKAIKDLGYAPKISVREGLQLTVKYKMGVRG